MEKHLILFVISAMAISQGELNYEFKIQSEMVLYTNISSGCPSLLEMLVGYFEWRILRGSFQYHPNVGTSTKMELRGLCSAHK